MSQKDRETDITESIKAGGGTSRVSCSFENGRCKQGKRLNVSLKLRCFGIDLKTRQDDSPEKWPSNHFQFLANLKVEKICPKRVPNATLPFLRI